MTKESAVSTHDIGRSEATTEGGITSRVESGTEAASAYLAENRGDSDGHGLLISDSDDGGYGD